MSRIWKILRVTVSSLMLLAVLLPATVYVVLSTDYVQGRITRVATEALKELTGADIAIGSIEIFPFDRLSVKDISVSLGNDTLASIDNVSAGFELFHFIRTGQLTIDYAYIESATFRLSRDTPQSPLNISPIVERFRSNKNSESKSFKLRINTVIMRNSELFYDVTSIPYTDAGKFDANHIHIGDFGLNAFIPLISDKGYTFHIDHLGFIERCGFELKSMYFTANISRTGLNLSELNISLPNSEISLAPISVSYSSPSHMSEALKTSDIHISTTRPASIYLPDLSSFLPLLSKIDQTFGLDFRIAGNLNEAEIEKFAFFGIGRRCLSLSLNGTIQNILSPDILSYDIPHMGVSFDGIEIAGISKNILKAGILKTLNRIPEIEINATIRGSIDKGKLSFVSDGTPSIAEGDLDYQKYGTAYKVAGNIATDELRLDLLSGNPNLGILTSKIEGVYHGGRNASANLKASVSEFEYNNYIYSGISAEITTDPKRQTELTLNIDDANARILAYLLYDKTDNNALKATVTASEIDLNILGFDSKHAGKRLGAKAIVDISGDNINNLEGYANIFDVKWTDRQSKGLAINNIRIDAKPNEKTPTLSIKSDYINGSIKGQYDFKSLPTQLCNMASYFMPAVIKEHQLPMSSSGENKFGFDFTISPCRNITSFFDMPIHNLHDINIDGYVDTEQQISYASIEAQYLQNGNKLIEDTDIFAILDHTTGRASVYATTQMPTKKGDMSVSLLTEIANNTLDTRIDWKIDRAIPINGTLSITAELHETKKTEGSVFPVDTTIDFRPGTINFGDDVWSINPSRIDITPTVAKVDRFRLSSASQSIDIDGTVGSAETDSLVLGLTNLSLYPIFETLEIDNALIGGHATGTFTAKNLLGSTPYLRCPDLHVDSIGYQYCTIGNADILAEWNNERKSFYLDADIDGLEGKKSRISGDIYPFNESLDISFDADSVPVGFLKPFMAAFTSDITGRASGRCRLYGTFKDIDLEGDIFADNVKIKIDFTGTSYTATDSVRLTPGKIILDNITIRDPEGHTALLNGTVGHKYFREPTFKFDITEAKDLLSYNVTSRENPDWYGTVYGNGGASVSGYPGVVNIDVAMTTAPKSKFTFVLNDRLDAEDYTFITFRDVTPDSLKTEEKEDEDIPYAVRAFKSNNNSGEESSSAYNMDIRVDITKDAAITLVMDPVGGDEIKAHGDGNMHMAYRSANNDFNIWGKYTVADGSYRFTLQDIIIKDFTIREGSMIQFDGDPYGVKTTLEAFYATTANLSDLDGSFLQDKEVARTKVPVHALMKVTGDIRQPSIDFDLEFPTLTSDTYRKVRSIVSTSDMMNRQIIYLLALNRFYTPDYMEKTTKGSELFSVASSTISSQLGNILGKLSDKWSIAPNLRSDKGDFSDVEVDVALSSRLLNNRLIFNGNFGYRDNTLNSNQFIGDFDIEYLLNNSGTWRLKAYNRYNDRNYYVRTAQTTQGLGIMFRREFDKFFNFLHPKKTEVKEETEDMEGKENKE